MNDSWEIAEREYQKSFWATFRTSSFSFEQKTGHHHSLSSEDRNSWTMIHENGRENAKRSFAILLTLLQRQLIAGKEWPEQTKSPTIGSGKIAIYSIPLLKGFFEFSPSTQEDIEMGKELLGEILYRQLIGDFDYFDELMKLQKAFTKELPMKARLFLCAKKLKDQLQHDPTKQDVEDHFYETTECRPRDMDNLFENARLRFLEGKPRGRPPKKSESNR